MTAWPFNQLERGFAGLMLRDDTSGEIFDPRTVELKFSIEGGNGNFVPLVLDIEASTIHWLDVQTAGAIQLNTLAGASKSITHFCPALMRYFASGTRASMLDLGRMHAAARSDRVYLRAPSGACALYTRRAGEDVVAFHHRLRSGAADEANVVPKLADPALALLARGDLDLPPETATYALFRERVTPTLAASDLLT